LEGPAAGGRLPTADCREPAAAAGCVVVLQVDHSRPVPGSESANFVQVDHNGTIHPA
jgi:hypothetical protein